MSARKDHIRVTVVAPGPGDGPNWQHVVRGPGVKPKRYSSGTTDHDEAVRLAAEREARMNARLAPRRNENPLAIVVMDRHVAFREVDRLTAQNTLEVYRCARAALAPALADTRAASLTTSVLEDAQQFLLTRSDRPLAPATVNLYLEKFKHAWEWARGKGHPSVGPWPGVEALVAERTAKREYTPDELERLLVEAARYGGDGRLVPLLCLMAELGPRVSEALTLRGRDVDRKRGMVTLHTPKTGRRGGRRRRTVPVSPEVLAMLPERRPDEWVFRAVLDPEKPLPYPTVQGALRTIRERAGLGGEPLDLHSLRRYAIRRVHAAGVPIKDAMDFFGHLSYRAHMVYMPSVATPEEQRAILERARAVHDPVAALPGQSPGRVRPRRASTRGGPTRHTLGEGGRGDAVPAASEAAGDRGDLDGSRDVPRSSAILTLSRDPRAARLARLLVDLAPANRAAVLEALQDDDLRAGALEAAREHWPELVRPQETRKERRHAR